MSDVCAGGSLGPEAALLALCGSTTSWLARKVFGARGQHLRNCALMGMTAGLAAFFGVALGGQSARHSVRYTHSSNLALIRCLTLILTHSSNQGLIRWLTLVVRITM